MFQLQRQCWRSIWPPPLSALTTHVPSSSIMQQMEDPWHTFIWLCDSMYKGSVVVSSIPFPLERWSHGLLLLKVFHLHPPLWSWGCKVFMINRSRIKLICYQCFRQILLIIRVVYIFWRSLRSGIWVTDILPQTMKRYYSWGSSKVLWLCFCWFFNHWSKRTRIGWGMTRLGEGPEEEGVEWEGWMVASTESGCVLLWWTTTHGGQASFT